MIKFSNDQYLDRIKSESKLATLKTKKEYLIYGLIRNGDDPKACANGKDDRNPAIWIQYDGKNFSSELILNLADFFYYGGILCETIPLYKNTKGCKIGLRIDLRKEAILAATALQTIIYSLEGKMDLDYDFVIPGIKKKFPHLGKY
jgi:hypothetical protein